MPTRAASIATLIAALAVHDAHAGGFGIPEIGVRRTSMGAVIGRPDDPSAVYHNPAGLVLQRGWRVYLSAGLALVRSELQLRPWDQSDRLLGATPEADGYYAPFRPRRALAVIPMLAVTGELLPGRLVLGAALYVGNAQGAAFDPEGVTRYHLIDGYVVAPQAVIAAAYRLREAITVGASVGVLNVRLHGRREVFPFVGGTDISSIIGTRAELRLDGSGWAPSWMLAAFGRPHPRLTWGATLTGRVDATMTGPVEVIYSDDAPVPGDRLAGTQRTTQLLPWAFMAGASFDLAPTVELGAEVRYWLYRQYEKQRTEIKGIALVRELETAKNFRDSWQASGGVRIHGLAALPGLELMAGVHFDRTPAPPETLTFDQPTFDHVGLHTGARWTAGRYRVGASYLRYWYSIPTVTDSITAPPSNFRGRGGNHIFTMSLEARL